MPSLLIRNLDRATKERLRVRAARRQRSMEEEARHILRDAVSGDEGEPRDLGAAIHKRFAPLGGVDLRLPARGVIRKPPTPRG